MINGRLVGGPVRAAWVATALAVLVVLPLGLLTRANWDPLIDVDVAVGDELVVPGRGTEVDVLRALTEWGGFVGRLLVLGSLAGWLAWQRRWRLVAFVIVGGGLVGLFNLLLKAIFDRPRPSYPGTIHVQESSFPSGHSAGAATVATVLALVFWPGLSRAGRGALLLFTAGAAAMVGYTRIALGVHFASDVVAGWCVGAGWVLVVAVVLRVWPGQPGTLGSDGEHADLRRRDRSGALPGSDRWLGLSGRRSGHPGPRCRHRGDSPRLRARHRQPRRGLCGQRPV